MSQEQGQNSSDSTAVAVGSSTFTLTITLGNDAMQTPHDIGKALRDVAKEIQAHDLEPELWRWIWDNNGNTVGKWEVS